MSVIARTPTTFRIIDTKLYVRIVTLSTKDNVKSAKQLSDGFEHSVYRNKQKLISREEVVLNTNGIGNIRKSLDSIFQGGKISFALAYHHNMNANGTDAHGRVKAYSY